MIRPSQAQRTRRYSTNDRNYNDPAYKEFRKAVLKRDGYCCQWPKCGSVQRLRVHHIRTWAKHPALRFIVGNGITLCYTCHDKIWNEEETYESVLHKIACHNSKGKPRERPSRRGVKKKNARGTKKKATSYAAKYAAAKRKARRRR